MTMTYGLGGLPAAWAQPAAWVYPAAGERPAAGGWQTAGTAAWPEPVSGAWTAPLPSPWPVLPMPMAAPGPRGPAPVWSPMAGGEGDPFSSARAHDLAMLRDQLVGELQAVNGYVRDAARASDPRVRARLLEIATDERHHVAELTQLIRELDPLQDQAFRQIQG
ncbi:MAG: ferritin-like domain-containing protein [Firmicutes bacterium]|nr:ferritin-like domain-containing protein [Bacillota bacterium]